MLRAPVLLLDFLPAFALLFAAMPALANEALWAALARGGHVILVRHAATDPGVGDPPGFRIDTCGTQRNLNNSGRAEAARLGAAFERRAIPVARVLSSRWCRCLETARIAFGKAEPWPALDNTFEVPQRRDPQMREVRRLLAQPVASGNLVLVTHGVNILALTGVSPATSELVIVAPGAAPRTMGRITVQ